MEYIEEDYLAKIIQGAGSKEIKVDEIIAITVEDEEDIGKFKDYNPSASDAEAAAPKGASAPTPPKKEVVEERVSSQEPKNSKPKMVEDHNLPLLSIKGTSPDGSS